ncbi:hypothetical protein ABL78_6458 [Leptomonas seymouri]|uniref:SAP domain-containing protein n=1 Tax=Leptomonas seymouri TaxID=5684 RepID=A0A0N1II75_LEPSE|nr:hypothetical protein ABL78_6458 [Leptomonas seymouri]|eukprot:KPI84495.1 hypothetical protein ABL78_6458 [Leptomonas seymouri]
MDPVKRRLVYVADESEALLSELSGTPPTKQSRMTLLAVPLSPPLSSQRSSDTVSPPPRPVATHDATVLQADKKLLVSYNGFLFADGSGRFATPHNAEEAALVRGALKTCRAYLRQFLAGQEEESNSSESSTNASSSTYVEEESEVGESSDDSSAPPRQRRAKAAAAAARPAASTQSPSKMTVAELKVFLRERGVPAVGNKANLVLRAQSLLVKEGPAARHDDNEDEATTTPRHSFQATASLDHHVRSSGASVSSLVSTPASSLLSSPTSRTTTENRSLWGALVTAGSRLFGGTARSSLGFTHTPTSTADDAPPAKRRRSA